MKRRCLRKLSMNNMLISCTFDGWCSNDPKSKDYYNFKYTLVDSHFGTVNGTASAPALAPPPTPTPAPTPTPTLTPAPAIIKEYRARNLNVEKNLFIFMHQLCKKYNWTIKQLCIYYDRCNDFPLWKTVNQKEFEKYTTLM
jgi:hypothetical protein